jgi:hypothetical protein
MAPACRADPPGPDPAPSSSTPASAPPPHRGGRPASAAELGVLAPLAPGSVLGGFTIREIRAVEHGTLRVVCARGNEVVRLDVALADPEGALPPATAGRYAIFYSLRGAAPEDGDRLAQDFAAVIATNAAAPVPAGMTTFTPDAKPGMAL